MKSQKEKMVHGVMCEICEAFPAGFVGWEPVSGTEKQMCGPCMNACTGIMARDDMFYSQAYGIRFVVGDTVENAGGNVGTIYRIVRERWAEANDMDWQETVISVRWDARTHENGVHSPHYYWDVRVDMLCEAEHVKLIKWNGRPIPFQKKG